MILSERIQIHIDAIDRRISEIHEAIKKTDSDNFDYFSGLELDHLHNSKAALCRHLQKEQMKEWNL